MRLNRFIALAGVSSRRGADDIIKSGRVTVNGKTVDQPGMDIDPAVDKVTVGHKRIEAEHFVYLLLNKPPETVTTLSDENGRPTVRDLIDLPERIFPVGRLDFKTSGVLLMTNDGALTQLLTHPSHGVHKVYEVVVHRKMLDEHVAQLRRGVRLEDGRTRPCRIEFIRTQGAKAVYHFTVREGRNRLVRRLVEHFDYHVRRLTRIEFAGLTAGGLKVGQWRLMTKLEIKKLRERIKNAGK
jgi:23S rRNA pseudouridine2605 synthase